jgi:hypothetical protein
VLEKRTTRFSNQQRGILAATAPFGKPFLVLGTKLWIREFISESISSPRKMNSVEKNCKIGTEIR